MQLRYPFLLQNFMMQISFQLLCAYYVFTCIWLGKPKHVVMKSNSENNKIIFIDGLIQYCYITNI